MDKVKFFTENWQLLSLVLGTGGGCGWLGWLFASKSRKIDLHAKVFKMNSEMIDGVKKDFEDRLNFFKEINNELDKIVKEQHQYIKDLKKELSTYRKTLADYQKKFGKLNEN